MPLSRDRVIKVAVELADEAGIDGLTMRALGQRLGVEAMTLYYHVGRKEQLLAAIADTVVAEMQVPEPGGDWREELRRAALSAHEVLERHPWATPLILTAPPVPARLRQMNGILGCLRLAGFPPETTDRAYHVLDSHIMGSALWITRIEGDRPDDLAARASDLLETLAADDLPWLAEHVEQHLKPPDPSAAGSFDFGLDLILDGLARLRAPGGR